MEFCPLTPNCVRNKQQTSNMKMCFVAWVAIAAWLPCLRDQRVNPRRRLPWVAVVVNLRRAPLGCSWRILLAFPYLQAAAQANDLLARRSSIGELWTVVEERQDAGRVDLGRCARARSMARRAKKRLHFWHPNLVSLVVQGGDMPFVKLNWRYMFSNWLFYYLLT